MATNGATQKDNADVNELTTQSTDTAPTPYFLPSRNTGSTIEIARRPSIDRVRASDPLVHLDRKGELSPRLNRNSSQTDETSLKNDASSGKASPRTKPNF